MKLETDQEIRVVANNIATRLFINGLHQVASRLQMMDGNERDLGGWCRAAVERQVFEAIKLYLVLDQPKPPTPKKARKS